MPTILQHRPHHQHRHRLQHHAGERRLLGIDGVVFRPVQGFKAKARTLLVYPRGSQDTGIRSFVSLIKPKR